MKKKNYKIKKKRYSVIEFFDNYSSMLSEAKYNTIHEEGNKLLTPQHMLQRLPIVLAQVKAGNTFENLRNETNVKKYITIL